MKLFTTIPLISSFQDDRAGLAPLGAKFRPRYGNRAASRRFLGLPLHNDAEYGSAADRFMAPCLAGCG